MLHVVTGGSGSGKSEYAEQKLCSLWEKEKTGQKIYLATMMPYGKETEEKIRRHRRMRKEKGFLTAECYLDLETFVGNHPGFFGKDSCVLLECMSNLLANEMFAGGDPARILPGIRALNSLCKELVVVTNEVCSETRDDMPDMVRYKKTLAQINRGMASMAAETEEVVYGIPLPLKPQLEKGRRGMELIVGGAFQGKLTYAKQKHPDLRWTDGASCTEGQAREGGGMFHFETWLRRLMEESPYGTMEKPDMEGLEAYLWEKTESILRGKRDYVIITREIGSGLVPVEPQLRALREAAGRICCRLALQADRVERVSCGIPMTLKQAERKDGKG